MAFVYQLQPGSSFTYAYDSGTSQDPIILPLGPIVTVTVSFDVAGSCIVQGTTSTLAQIAAGTATWVDWDEGTASEAGKQDQAVGATALRMYRISGTPRMDVTISGAY